ncbi:MAG TPA: glycosyltransferase family 39 protein [Steroidobacteraceae bacterium]|nr:glycosyltransferase family 39 protein [Steroidobacteraceae bacterium]
MGVLRARRRLALLVVAALAPLWLIGIFGRALWTPDEPREADIAWRMSQQSDRTLPELAGVPFLEKPPLSYWMSAAGIRAFGDSPGGARAPNLLYALVTALAIGALARAMQLEAPQALLAALLAGSALTAFRVQSWLAPDACLLAGNALALLGVWGGYTAPPGRAKLLGYTLMHAGAAIGFMAKSAPGWLVPALALGTLILWERRWAELRRAELYAGFALQALLIAPWIMSVAREPAGAGALRTLFWNNLAGRFAHIEAPPGLDYARGHRNAPGKYFRELPLYLLPWTLIMAAALARAWPRVRAAGGGATAWRFALASSLPLLVLLSFAATARDIYAAPSLLGLAVLAALWAQEAQRAPTRLDSLCVAGTSWLVGLLGAALLAGLAVLMLSGAASVTAALAAAGGILLLGGSALRRARRAHARGALAKSLTLTYAAYAAAVCLSALVAFPVIDRWQDLGALGREIRADTRAQPLALLAPDETTLAMIDHGASGSYSVLGSDDRPGVERWFAARGAQARILVLLPGHAAGDVSRWLSRWHRSPPPGDGTAAALIDAGAARLVQRYELPQGRRYALLGPPGA